MTGNRHGNIRKVMYACRLKMSKAQAQKCFVNGTLLDQLDACKDDESRRLLLGISKKQSCKTA